MKILIILLFPIVSYSQTFIIDKAVVIDYKDSTVADMGLPIILEIGGNHVTVTSIDLEETFITQYRINKHNIVCRSSDGTIALLETIKKPLALRIRYSNKTYTFYAGKSR